MSQLPEWEVLKPAVLALADAVLDARVSAMGEIQLRDAGVGLVGDEHRQAIAVVIGEGLLIAVTQLRAPSDQPGFLRPRREVHAVGDLDHVGVLAL